MAKLNYLQMLGYDISWAGFNIIEVSSWYHGAAAAQEEEYCLSLYLCSQVMSSTKFTEKRIGYLAASQSFHQDTEVPTAHTSNPILLPI